MLKVPWEYESPWIDLVEMMVLFVKAHLVFFGDHSGRDKIAFEPHLGIDWSVDWPAATMMVLGVQTSER